MHTPTHVPVVVCGVVRASLSPESLVWDGFGVSPLLCGSSRILLSVVPTQASGASHGSRQSELLFLSLSECSSATACTFACASVDALLLFQSWFVAGQKSLLACLGLHLLRSCCQGMWTMDCQPCSQAPLGLMRMQVPLPAHSSP
jgi:hypothetical protein